MSVTLTIYDIGRAGQSDATVVTKHGSYDAALTALVVRYGGNDSLRHSSKHSGTIGSMSGRVFQASRTWRIDNTY